MEPVLFVSQQSQNKVEGEEHLCEIWPHFLHRTDRTKQDKASCEKSEWNRTAFLNFQQADTFQANFLILLL